MTRHDRLHIAAMLRLHPDLQGCAIMAGDGVDFISVRRDVTRIEVEKPRRGFCNVQVWRKRAAVDTLIDADECLYLGGRTRAGDTIDAIVACAKRHLW